jgi:hypothetical protein
LIEVNVRYKNLLVVASCFFTLSAMAEQQQVQPRQQQPAEWSKLPRMQLERQFAGPLQDTLIQRWRDPVDGTICYLYLPMLGTHSAPTASGYVEYGANTIGSISCNLAPRPSAAPTARPSPAPAPPGGNPALTATAVELAECRIIGTLSKRKAARGVRSF